MDDRIRIEPRPGGKAHIAIKCRHGYLGWCRQSLWSNPAHGVPERGVMWQWDGNLDAPTITPSIACQRCPKHFTVSQGNVQGELDP